MWINESVDQSEETGTIGKLRKESMSRKYHIKKSTKKTGELRQVLSIMTCVIHFFLANLNDRNNTSVKLYSGVSEIYFQSKSHLILAHLHVKMPGVIVGPGGSTDSVKYALYSFNIDPY